MLEFFRKYQRYFFTITAVVVIASFSFFGTYSTFAAAEEPEDRAIGQLVDGSPMMLLEVQKLSRFISTDSGDSVRGSGLVPNLCNNGVIRADFIKDGLAERIVEKYFDQLLPDLEVRLEKAKRYQSYTHPQAPFISAKSVWQHFLPNVNEEIAGLKLVDEVSPKIFSSLAQLYEQQGKLHPEMLRRILMHQHQQYPGLEIDHRLSQDDLAIFGYHSASDWFGKAFVDLTAEFILNAASIAKEKGYRVSLDEAKGDLIHNFQTAVKRMQASGMPPQFGFSQHLRSLGFNERSAAEVWQKVLLFRKLFHDVGESAFVDRLPYRDFAEYAKEKAVVQSYEWPITLSNKQDLAEFKAYIKAISPDTTRPLPDTFFALEKIEKERPKLIQTTYRASVGEVSKKQLCLKPTLKELWQWQTEAKNWNAIRAKFSLENGDSAESRFAYLQALEPGIRAKVDTFSREKIVEENPSWVEEALSCAPSEVKSWTVYGNESPDLHSESTYYRVENLEQIDKRILTFSEARGYLKNLVGTVAGEISPKENPFAVCSDAALVALKMNPEDTEWIQSNKDPIADQFKLERKTKEIFRTSKEDWMRNQAFFMLPDLWSPIHVADDGKVAFFYLEERKTNPEPILEHIYAGKQTLAADAKNYYAEKLLEKLVKENAIVIPNSKED